MSLAAQTVVHQLLAEDTYSKSSTQINLPENLADFLIIWGRNNIPDKHLWYDEDGGGGREDEPHVTVRYGVLGSAPSKALKELCLKTAPFTVKLGETALFEQDDHDVLYVKVESRELNELNAAIETKCDCAPNTHKGYKPHATIAYVKKGAADKLVGQTLFADDPGVGQWEAQTLWFMGKGDSEDPERKVVALAFGCYRKESADDSATDFMLRHTSDFGQPKFFSDLAVGAQFRDRDGLPLMVKVGPTKALYKNEPDGVPVSIYHGRVVFPPHWDENRVKHTPGIEARCPTAPGGLCYVVGVIGHNTTYIRYKKETGNEVVMPVPSESVKMAGFELRGESVPFDNLPFPTEAGELVRKLLANKNQARILTDAEDATDFLLSTPERTDTVFMRAGFTRAEGTSSRGTPYVLLTRDLNGRSGKCRLSLSYLTNSELGMFYVQAYKGAKLTSSMYRQDKQTALTQVLPHVVSVLQRYQYKQVREELMKLGFVGY